MKYVSPYEQLLKIKLNVSYFRVFRCVCFVFIPSSDQHKLEKKANKCVFVGYDSERKGWRCYDLSMRKCSVSWNVVFDETSSWWSEPREDLPYIIKDKESVNSYQVYLPFFGILSMTCLVQVMNSLAKTNLWMSVLHKIPGIQVSFPKAVVSNMRHV